MSEIARIYAKLYEDRALEIVSIQSFFALIKSMKHVDELDRPIVQALIERIEIGESRTDGDSVRNQQIDIFYKFIGKVDL